MPWLDPRVRCNRCGTPFSEGSTEVCPRCGADLAAVGLWSELREWGVTRQRGRARFLRRRVVLPWVGVLAISVCVGYARRGEVDLEVYARNALFLAAWYPFGRLYWRRAEREYAEWQSRQAEPGHAGPMTAPGR